MGTSWAIAAILALAAAGCATPAQDASTPDAVPPLHEAAVNATTPGLAPVAANVSSETLHFGEPPLLSLLAPNHTVLVPKGATATWQTFSWNTTARHAANVTEATTDVWLRLTASQVQAGAQDPGCTVVATLTFTFASDQPARGVSVGCGSAGVGVLAPGDHEVRFTSPPGAFTPPVLLAPGDGIHLDVTVYTESTGFGPTCYVLAGPGSDSSVRLVGLNETMPAMRPLR